ncbi:hypothetical protein [uncultured Methanobrevibacter sp.]|jgi:hypothetical protein|uniref:hypothetical protein n=1 Tax=uncultured Methanobrevibacter sp. TaxID=253161 RepID=UPI0025D18C80|nr:hypothetical protein [uncultured Methanobrevibacter sp.]
MAPFIFINPWWVHHCAGTLEPENDPYSDEFQGIDFSYVSTKDILKFLAFFVLFAALTIVFFMVFIPWTIDLMFTMETKVIPVIIIFGGLIVFLLLILLLIKKILLR